MDKEKKIKLDKFYNPSSKKEGDYSDNLSLVVDDILTAQTSGKISTGTAKSLLKFAIILETKREVDGLGSWIENLQDSNERHSLSVNFSRKEKKYA